MDRIDIARKLEIKFNQLVDIIPSKFKNEFKNKAYIAGGCIYSMANDITVNDYDFFLQDEEFAQRLYKYFSQIAKGKGYRGSKTGLYKGHKIIVSKYAISFGEEFQVVIKYVGTPKEVCEEFDFMHNKFVYIPNYGEPQLTPFTEWKYLETDKLTFNDGRVRDICGTIQRLPKMVEKGFKVSKREVSKMLKKLSENGFDDREMEIIEDIASY